ncbi:hypothetical protein M3Y98_00177700 [Aphelenchoides besseyi]|nr:hypothetical protein M3Y98_00177700 [Aphelenchoides besseyi]KAI6200073.1 hypothetical protein M3Y96_00694600 [Aphelenchoides besseyi]
MLSCSLAMSNSVMYFDETAGTSQLPFMNLYYSTGPEYVHEEADDKSSITYTFNDYSPSSYSPYPDSQSVSSYSTESLDSPNFIGEDDFFAIPFESSYCNVKQETQCETEQRQMQIQRNEQIARLLSPFRKFQERVHEQQTRKHAENARRKFSLTNGMRQKRRKLDLNRPTQKPNISVRRWKTEIASKLKGHDFPRQKPAPIALPTDSCVQVNWQPEFLTHFALHIQGNKLVVNKKGYHLDGNVRIVAFGKAGVEMVRGAEEALGRHVLDGIALVPCKPSQTGDLKSEFYEGAEGNLPDQQALENTIKLLDFLDKKLPNKSELLVLFLVSGGGSALLTAPVQGVSLSEKLEVTRLLASNGADINELNDVRMVLSNVKGGKLVKRVAPSRAISLIISDIVGGQIEKVSSGPTVPQNCCPIRAEKILKKFDLWHKIPESVRKVIKTTCFVEEISSAEINNVLICDNRILLEKLKDRLESNDIPTLIVNAELTGNAQDVGKQLSVPLLKWICDDLSNLSVPFSSSPFQFLVPNSKVFAWLYGGETTVRFPTNLNNTNPKGGRNQEMSLSVLHELQKCMAEEPPQSQSKRSFIFMSLGSDGQDGPTDAAGAFVSSESWKGTSLEEVTHHLENKSSYDFWSKFQNGRFHVKTGKTGSNLMDCQLIVFISS